MAEGVLKKEYKASFLTKYFNLLPCLFAVVLLLFFIFFNQSGNKSDYNSAVAEMLTAVSFVSVGAVGFVLYKYGKLDTKSVVALLFVCGFAVRLAYALRYGYSVNQHDVEGLNSSGHLSYIYSLAQGNGLPQSNDWQYSHPPLHHILAAVVVKVSTALGHQNGQAFENIQLLTCLYSTMTMFAGHSLLKLCGIKGNNLVFAACLLAFHPIFQILAGSINNDILTILLSMYAVVFLLKWYQSPSVKYAAFCGLFAGLGMMSKVSAALIAVAIAVSVLVKFFIDKELKFSKVLLHASVFAAILLPLGLWHPIRNYILFEQPLGYVAPIPTTSALYTGEISIIDRIVLPFSKDGFGVYVDVWEEYNVWFYTLRNSLFGEYNFGDFGFAGVLVLLNLILIVASLVALVYVCVKVLKKNVQFIPIVSLFAVQLAFFVYFNVKYPFGCSMDFRYIVPLLFCGIAFLGTASQALEQSDNIFVKTTVNSLKFVTVAFCLLSFVVMF